MFRKLASLFLSFVLVMAIVLNTSALAEAENFSVGVDWNNVVRDINPLAYGVNSDDAHIPISTANPDFLDTLTYLGGNTGLLRIHSTAMVKPGSTKAWVDANGNWDEQKIKDSLAPIVERGLPIMINIPGLSTDNRLKLASEIPQFAAFAAELVKIVNVVHGFNVRYWEVPNEKDPVVKGTLTAVEMAEVLKLSSRAMKAVDPTILVGGPATADVEGNYQYIVDTFSHSYGEIDFWTAHVYPGGATSLKSDKHNYDHAQKTAQIVQRLRSEFDRISPDKHIPLFLTEYNVGWERIPVMHTHKEAVYDALIMSTVIQAGAEATAFWHAEGSSMGLSNARYDVYPGNADIHHLYARYFHGQLVSTISQDNGTIVAYAAKSTEPGNKDRYSVSIINRSDADKNVVLDFTSWAGPASVDFYQYSGYGYTGRTTREVAALTGAGFNSPAHSVTIITGGTAANLITGIPYRLISKSSGKAVETDESGANVQQGTYERSARQKWIPQMKEMGYHTFGNRTGSEQISLAEWSKQDGVHITMGVGDHSDLEKYVVQDSGGGYYTLRNKYSGKYWSVQDGGGIQQWADDGTNPDNRFAIEYAGNRTNIVESRVYKIVNKQSGKALTVRGGSSANNTKMEQSDYIGADNQRFKISWPNNAYRLIPMHAADKVVNISGERTDDGATAQIETFYWDGGKQLWLLDQDIDGYYKLTYTKSGKVMDVEGASLLNGAGIVQQTYDDQSDSQKWTIVEVESTIPPPTPPLPAGTLQSNYFDSGSASGWTALSGTWGVIDGEYRQLSTSGTGITLSGDSSWADYMLQAKVKNVSSGTRSFGLIARYKDNDNYYFAVYERAEAKWKLYKRVSGANHELGTYAESWPNDTYKTVKMTVNGSSIRLNVDGQDIIAKTDSVISKGKVGLRTNLNAAAFDEVIVIEYPKAVPQAPEGVSAVVGDSKAVVSFTPAANDEGSFITGYSVTAWRGAAAEATVTGKTSPIIMTGLLNGETYTFTVKASNMRGDSAASVHSGPVIPNPPPPAAPANLRGIPGDGVVSLHWNEAAGASSYTVYSYEGAAAPYDPSLWSGVQNGVTDATYSISGLTNGLSYTFAVKAVNAGGASGFSSAVTVTPATYADTAAPTWNDSSRLVVSDVTQSSVRLSWPEARDNVLVEGYRIYIDGSEKATVSRYVYEHTVTGLNAGTVYTFKVTAYDQAGNESEGLTAEAMTSRTAEGGNDGANSNGDDNNGNGGPLDSQSQTPGARGGVQVPADPTNKRNTVTLDLDKDAEVTNELTPEGTAVTRVTVDVEALDKALVSHAVNPTVIIGVNSMDPSVAIELPSSVLLNAAKQQNHAIIQIQSNIAMYELPIQALSRIPENGYIRITISQISGQAGMSINAAVTNANARQIIDHPISFSITADGEEISDLNGVYTNRTITLGEPADPAKVTAVWVDSNYQMHFVPSVIRTTEGRSDITIRSPHNSNYTVIRTDRSFADLNGHWAHDAVQLLTNKRIVDGKTEHQFSPDSLVTRSEFTALLVRSLGHVQAEVDMFQDVQASDWFAGAVGAAYQAGLIDGYEDGTFRPHDMITREQMAVMIVRALKVGGQQQAEANQTSLDKLADRTLIGKWSEGAVAQLLEADIVQGLPGEVFAPQQHATRAEAATILKRMLHNLEFIN